jgi:hypothetical protein
LVECLAYNEKVSGSNPLLFLKEEWWSLKSLSSRGSNFYFIVFINCIFSCLAGLFGRYLGSWGAAIITTSCLFLSLLISFFIFYEVALVGCFVYIKLATWIKFRSFKC